MQALFLKFCNDQSLNHTKGKNYILKEKYWFFPLTTLSLLPANNAQISFFSPFQKDSRWIFHPFSTWLNSPLPPPLPGPQSLFSPWSKVLQRGRRVRTFPFAVMGILHAFLSVNVFISKARIAEGIVINYPSWFTCNCLSFIINVCRGHVKTRWKYMYIISYDETQTVSLSSKSKYFSVYQHS